MDQFASTMSGMALASSTTRSTTAPTPTQSTTNHLGGGGNSSTPKLSPATSLPFTFLIAFIAIFLFFIACGCGSRRYILQMRRRLSMHGREPAAVAPKVAGSDLEKPVLWDVQARMEAEDEGGWARVEKDGVRSEKEWAGMQPLSATYLRAPEDSSLPAYSAGLSRPPRWRARRIGLPPVLIRTYDRIPFLPSFISPPAPYLSHDAALTPAKPLPPVVALQMSFTIAMPSERRNHQSHRNMRARNSIGCGESMATSLTSRMSEDSVLDEKRKQREVVDEELGEYVLGMTEVPWRNES